MTDSELHQFALDNFKYEDGQLRRIKKIYSISPGEIIGTPTKGGYIKVKICGGSYLLHRIIFLMHHGYTPELVDHIDRNKNNNKIENLRATSKSINAQNSCSPSSGRSSKFRGVSFRKDSGKWSASIRTNGKTTRLGSFENETDAYLAYVSAQQKYHPGAPPLDAMLAVIKGTP